MARKRLAGWRIGAAIFACCTALLAGQAHAALPQFEQPGWMALTPEQKSILAPLEKEWAEMDAFRRKKWIGIAERYPDMNPMEQASLQRNMREWARLAPEERKAAREKYKSLRRISPEERQVVKQKWEEYSTLTEEEKERLRSKAPKQPKIKTPAKPPELAASPSPEKRIATPPVPVPMSPISPRKPPQNPLTPNATKPLEAATAPAAAAPEPDGQSQNN